MSEQLLKTLPNSGDFQAEYEGSISGTCREPGMIILTWLRCKSRDSSFNQLQNRVLRVRDLNLWSEAGLPNRSSDAHDPGTKAGSRSFRERRNDIATNWVKRP